MVLDQDMMTITQVITMFYNACSKDGFGHVSSADHSILTRACEEYEKLFPNA